MRRRPFLTLVAASAVLPAAGAGPSALGRATVLAGPAACAGQTCYTLDVACPEVVEDVRVELRVGDPVTTERGTILFTTGGGGGGLWKRFGPDAARVLGELRNTGFQTVQLSWPTGWLVGSAGQLEGHARLACRPATVARWVLDTIHAPAVPAASKAGVVAAAPAKAGPLCATGNSGGSAQISYMLTDYGLAEDLAAVVPTGGPPMGRIDLGCLQTDPADAALWYSRGSAGTIDKGFGFDSRGPCSRQDESARPLFEESSLAFGDRDYVYPTTMVWFVHGENDRGNAVPQGRTYYERLLAAASPLVRWSTAPETPHATPSTRAGAEMIRDILLAECRSR